MYDVIQKKVNEAWIEMIHYLKIPLGKTAKLTYRANKNTLVAQCYNYLSIKNRSNKTNMERKLFVKKHN